MTEKKGPLDRLSDLRGEIEGEAKEVVSFVGSLKRAFFSDCSRCGDTGLLPNGAYCSCAKGEQRITIDERAEKRAGELAGGRPKILPRGPSK